MQIIYGVNPIIECLRAERREVKEILYSRETLPEKLLQISRTRNIRIKKVPPHEIEKLAGKHTTHQGVIAVVSSYPYINEKTLASLSEKIIAVLDGVEDPMNLGAILRTAYAFNIKTVILPQTGSVHITPVVVKASAGAVEWLKVSIVKNILKTVRNLKEKGYTVCALDPAGKTSLKEFVPPAKVILIAGSEGRGIRKSLLMESDYRIYIPANITLNVSVAFAVAVYHISTSTSIQFNSK